MRDVSFSSPLPVNGLTLKQHRHYLIKVTLKTRVADELTVMFLKPSISIHSYSPTRAEADVDFVNEDFLLRFRSLRFIGLFLELCFLRVILNVYVFVGDDKRNDDIVYFSGCS